MFYDVQRKDPVMLDSPLESNDTMLEHQVSRGRKLSVYPDPLVVPPPGRHKQTWIVLHGRGSNAQKFASEFLSTVMPIHGTLRLAFPNTKFIFPTAASSRATIYKRSLIHQWFDNWSLEEPSKKEELQAEGLRRTTLFVHDLLVREIAVVGAENVVLGGLSQGCAAALISMLLWKGESLAMVFGLCGWLPYRERMQDMACPANDDADDIYFEDDMFDRSNQSLPPNGVPAGDSSRLADPGMDITRPSPVQQAIEFLEEELDLSASDNSSTFTSTPIFLGHGTADEKVPVSLAREADICFQILGTPCLPGQSSCLKEYEGLGHWYSAEMLKDLADFVTGVLQK